MAGKSLRSVSVFGSYGESGTLANMNIAADVGQEGKRRDLEEEEWAGTRLF